MFPPCRRPWHGHGSTAPSTGAWPGHPPLAQGEVGGAERTYFEPAWVGSQHGSGEGTTPSAASQETRLIPPLTLPSAGRRRRHEADPRGSGRDGTPFPPNRSYRCHHHRHHPHWGILLQAPPFAWTLLDAPLTLGDRDSSSFPFSFPSPLRTSAFLRTGVACRDRPRPPLLEASRIGRRSVPARAKTSLKRDRRKSRIEAMCKKRTY